MAWSALSKSRRSGTGLARHRTKPVATRRWTGCVVKWAVSAYRKLSDCSLARRSLAKLDLPNHQALPCRFHDRFGHFIQRVDFEDSLDLCQQAIEQPEVAAGHSDDHRDRFRVKRPLWKFHAGRRPTLSHQLANFCVA